MGRLPSSTLAMVFLILVGCSALGGPEDSYLRTVQNHATQDEIKQRLGPPLVAQSLDTGETIWRYESYGYHGGDRNTPGQIWCDRYSLAFDQQSVLRHWDYHWDRTCIW